MTGLLLGVFAVPPLSRWIEGSPTLGGNLVAAPVVRAAPINSERRPQIRYVPGKLLVKFRDRSSARDEAAALDHADVTPTGTLKRIDVHTVAVEPDQQAEAVATLKASAAVEYVERDVLMHGVDTTPNDQLWRREWGLQKVHVPKAWDTTKGSPNVVIAVLDTGADFRHPDLQGAFVQGYDFVNGDVDPSDDHGHGTSVAGVIAARTNNAVGQAGACWTCALMPVKVLDASGSGASAVVARGITWAVDHGARVISLSLGSPGTTQTLTDAIAYARSNGVIPVAAAGNSGSTAPFYPAAYPDVLSVAGTNESDVLYSWSNRGDWVKVAAPGCNTAPRLGGGYVEFCGTSSATPEVAGLAGLALAFKPSATAVQVTGAIETGAVPFSDTVQHGRVDARDMLTALGLPEAPAPKPVAPAPSPRPRPPIAVAAPAIQGRSALGQTLRASTGSWSGASPMTFTYGWLRCDGQGARCAALAGATVASYTVTPADQGARLRVAVTASNGAGSALAVSAPTAPLRAVRLLTLLSAIGAGPNPLTAVHPALGRPVPPQADDSAPAQRVYLSAAEELERPILNQLNTVRRAHGLRPLRLSSALARAADDHVRALALAGQFRHEWSDGRAFKLWIRRYYPIGGARFWSVGENLIWSSGGLDAAQTANAWLASPGHRRVLLMASWRELGIGVVRAQGAGGQFGGADVYIAAADFGVRS